MTDELECYEGKPSMSNGKDLRAVGERVDALIENFSGIADPSLKENAEELVRSLLELYGAALARILEIVDETGRAEEFMDHLTADDLVASLLILHGLHPHSVETRIIRALEQVRPYLGSHGGDVKLLDVKNDVVRLRLEGSCHGCPSSMITMKLAVEKAIQEAAPEVVRIEVDGAAPAAAVGGPAMPQDAQTNGQNFQLAQGEWIALEKLPQFNVADLAVTELAGLKIILCRVGETFYAYQDSCPSCGVGLGGAALQKNILICSSCARRYDVRRAGQCLDVAELHIEPLPLLAWEDGIKIAVPTAPA